MAEPSRCCGLASYGLPEELHALPDYIRMLQWRPLLCCCLSALRSARCCRNSRSFSRSLMRRATNSSRDPDALALAVALPGSSRGAGRRLQALRERVRSAETDAHFPEHDVIEVDGVSSQVVHESPAAAYRKVSHVPPCVIVLMVGKTQAACRRRTDAQRHRCRAPPPCARPRQWR